MSESHQTMTARLASDPRVVGKIKLVGGPPVAIRHGAWDGEFKTLLDLTGLILTNRWDEGRWFITGWNGHKYILHRETDGGQEREYRTPKEISLCYYVEPPRMSVELASLN